MSQTTRDTKLHIVLLLSLAVVFMWSFVGCFDLFTWFLEALPVMIGAAVLILVYWKFRFTGFTYTLIWLHAIILLVGAHYTYCRTPLFNWIRDAFELSRNHYDRVGHLAQGFVPAIIAREVLLRKSPLQKGLWLFSIVVCFCLAIAAFYELFEWLTAIAMGDHAGDLLAIQGDIWDTQKDMALCLVGAVISLLTLGRLHDRALKNLAI